MSSSWRIAHAFLAVVAFGGTSLAVAQVRDNVERPAADAAAAPGKAAAAKGGVTTKVIFYRDPELQTPFKPRVTEPGKIVVYFETCDSKIETIKFSEAERNTRIYDELSALAKRGAAGATADARSCTGNAEFQPQLYRSTITLSARNAAGTEVGSFNIIYGPVEHWSLGVDLPVTNRKTLKYDEASKSLLPKDKNPAVYLSLNYSFGDVQTDPRQQAHWQRVHLKAIVSASSKPLDSYGFGIGTTLDKLPFLDIPGVSVFAGHFVTKSDTISNGVPQIDQGTKRTWRVGVSYDLGAGIKWLKF